MKIDEVKQKLENISNINIKKLSEIRDSFILKSNEIKKYNFPAPIIFKDKEKMMSIILVTSDETIHYSIICKNAENYSDIEKLLCEKYPEYQDKIISFTLNKNEINTLYNLQDDNIKNCDIITLLLNNGQKEQKE